MEENLIEWLTMGTFVHALAVDCRGTPDSWLLAEKPTHRLDPGWKTPVLPFYRGAQIVGWNHLAWSSMTAVVVDLRSAGQILTELNAGFTRICIALEEVGGIFQIGGERSPREAAQMARGTISVIPPGSRAYGKGDDVTFMRQLILQVDQQTLCETFGPQIDAACALAPRLMVSNIRLRRLGQIIAEECTAGTAMSRAYGDSMTMAVLSALADSADAEGEQVEARGGLAPWRLTQVTQYLFENLSERLELNTQAAIAGLSKSHYCRAFKASLGLSPHQWLLAARVEKAKQYLLEEETPLAEIALAVGFTDQAHFTHTFSRLVGASPRAWQRARCTPPEPPPNQRSAFEVIPGSLHTGSTARGASNHHPFQPASERTR
ncbi:helix-turn-helix domain-containing protein [Microvirga sesbaniae]|uniref:helix-turn-helix domain-containing protein n=1 Tax=Microvirga sesbaniae TaxID=681392 RepID=UPI0021CA26C5|nr:helix-turn-helix domain-containing protein [Microvirga sp. HBU67692]